MKRRDFVNTALYSTLIPTFSKDIHKKSPPSVSTQPPSDNILIVIQLEGGNDALNMLVPVDQYDKLNAVRPNLIAPLSSLLPLAGQNQVKLHPAMKGIQALYDEGKIKFIQAVGYPNHSRSHALAKDSIMSGLAVPNADKSGWLGRYLSYINPTYPNFNGFPSNLPPDPLAIEFGDYNALLLRDTVASKAINVGNAIDFNNAYWAYKGSNFNLKTDTTCPIDEPIPNYTEGGTIARLKYLRTANQLNTHYLNRMYKIYDNPNNSAYRGCVSPWTCSEPQMTLQLRIIAQLINSGLNTPVYVVCQRGYDTHANQKYDQGVALADLSNAIKTFQDTLNATQRNRVIGLVTTEFGRTITENSAQSTDHATAHSTFLFGEKIHCPILGSNPVIPKAAVFNDPTQFDAANNITRQFEYRDIYASILRQWFCMTPDDTKAVLQGDYNTLPIIKNPTCGNIMTPKIVGSDKVCTDGTVGYTAQAPTQLPVSYTWSVVNGQIISGQGTNTVFVKWGTSGNAAIKVEVTLK